MLTTIIKLYIKKDNNKLDQVQRPMILYNFSQVHLSRDYIFPFKICIIFIKHLVF